MTETWQGFLVLLVAKVGASLVGATLGIRLGIVISEHPRAQKLTERILGLK